MHTVSFILYTLNSCICISSESFSLTACCDVSLEKLIEGLKSPDTSSLILPDLLSLSDPFSGSVEELVKGVRL